MHNMYNAYIIRIQEVQIQEEKYTQKIYNNCYTSHKNNCRARGMNLIG